MRYSPKLLLLIGFVIIALLFAGIALGTSGEGGEIAVGEYCGCIEKGVTRVRMTPMTQFYIDTFLGDFEAKGASIRNTWSGSITLNEIPGAATIRAVYLYWMVLNPYPACSTGTFDGNTLDGVLVGRDEDPCWGLSESCYVWRQEVTSWVSGNGTYAVEIDSVADGTSNDRGEGASLIALYEDAAEPEKVFLIYDGCVTLKGALEEYSWSMMGFTADVPCTDAKTAFIIGDGQGVGQGDSMFYNGTCIDWNTTEGYDGPYWDTRTYDVTALTPGGSNQSNYRYHPASTSRDDCVTLGVCVLGVSRDLIGIEMTSFTAHQSSDGIVLAWRMESELDISHYVLKRARLGSEYSVIATIPGKGNSPQPHRYTFIDGDIEQQASYRYMLGAVSLNGKEGWVGPVSVTTRKMTPALRILSSNPVREVFQMSYTMATSGWLDVEIRDSAGRLVEMLSQGYFSPGEYEFGWSAESVSEGIYFIVVRGEKTTETRKAVLVR
jgi:hypothetical protein